MTHPKEAIPPKDPLKIGKPLFTMLIVVAGAVFVALLGISAINYWRTAAMRKTSENNLSQIGKGMHSYDSANQELPPQATRDQEGNKLMSWRWAIQPYIEMDSYFNPKAQSKVPGYYNAPDGNPTANLTPYKVFDGVNTPFAIKERLEKEPMRSKWSMNELANTPRGSSNLIFCVETGDPVIWTKPEDIEYDPNKPIPELKPIHPGGIHLLMGDGRVIFVRGSIGESVLRASIDPESTSREILVP